MTQVKQWVAGTPRLVNRQFVGPIPYCEGCHHPVFQKLVCEVLDELGIGEKAIMVVGVTCGGMAANLMQVDVVGTAHGRAPDVATAIKRVKGGKPIVFTLQGDGDCIAIGAESLIHAGARAEKITIFMINNANYGTTGGQLAPTTIMGQVTSTTPRGRDIEAGLPINAPALLAPLSGVAYAARGALCTPAYLQRTRKYITTAFQKQIDGVGLSFVEVLSPCPPNWHMTPLDCLRWIEEKMIPEFPLGEYKNVDSINQAPIEPPEARTS